MITHADILDRFEASVQKQQRIAAVQKQERSRLKRVLRYAQEIRVPYLLRLVSRFVPWLPIRSITVSIFTGHRLALPFKDKRTHELNYFGLEGVDCEIRLARHYLETLNEKSIFFDIGANFGYFTAIGEIAGAQVCAFEANEKLCQLLERNFGQKIEVVNALVAKEDGKLADFFLVEGNEGRSTAHAGVAALLSQARLAVRKVEAQTISIDSYVKQTQRVPSHVKIDVEGGEYDVLRGMENVLREHGPEVVMEVWGQDKFELSKEAALFLMSVGYAPFFIGKSRNSPTTLAEISKMNDRLDNIIFLKEA